MKQHFYAKNLLPFKIKGIDEEGTFSGYASVFDHLDEHGDRVKKGAFLRSLCAHSKAGTMPKMLWQHEQNEPIGCWLEIKEDDYGLFVRGKILLDLQRGREAYALLKARALDSLSIGYRIMESEAGRKSGERHLTELELLEISLVTFAANREARILQFKKLNLYDQALIKRIKNIADSLCA